MARSRNIKPSLFKNEVLGEFDPLLTILFIGLWCLADRDGILEDRPKRIKAEIFPYREISDINRYLTDLERLGFIRRYSAVGEEFIYINNFSKHQSPHKTEKPSAYPKPLLNSNSCHLTDKTPLNNGSVHVTESLIPDSLLLIPDSLIPDRKDTADKPPRSPRFVKPTIKEIRAYCEEIESTINPATFFNHYETVGWKVGRNPMKDWKAAVRGWTTRERTA